MQSLSAAELRRWISEQKSFLLVDVREAFERDDFHIGGLHLPMSELGQRWHELRQDRPIVVYCAKGIRSAIAIQRLEGTAGMPAMYNLEGGMKGWKETPSMQ
jgi:adenylyltransferase/sulfurtransferase